MAKEEEEKIKVKMPGDPAYHPQFYVSVNDRIYWFTPGSEVEVDWEVYEALLHARRITASKGERAYYRLCNIAGPPVTEK